MDSVLYQVLVYLAVKRMDANPGVNCFTFSKSEFIVAYRHLLRLKVVPFRKWETLLRNLRKHAAQGKVIRYFDPEKGVYETCISSLEQDRRWKTAVENARKAVEELVLMVRLPDTVYERLVEIAEAKRKSIQDILVEALKTYLEVTKG